MFRLKGHPFFRRIGFFLTVSTLFMSVMLACFTVFYHYTEGLSWLDSVYFTVITTRTIGFGDISPRTTAGKLGTIFNALLPATIFLGTSLVILEHLFKLLEMYWKGRLVHRMKNHTIIVTEVDLMESIINECLVENELFVIVHASPEENLPVSIQELINDSNYYEGDPTKDSVLKHLRIEDASRILIASADDTANMYVLVTAKSLNPDIAAIVRVNQKETEVKFKAVGADYLLPTSTMMGRMFLQAAIHPVAHHFLINLHTRTADPFLEEVPVPSNLIGQSIPSQIPQPIAVYRDQTYHYDFSQMVFQSGDIMIQICERFTG
jgi:voltage-gated potassium channel